MQAHKECYDGVWPNMGGVWVEVKRDFIVDAANGNFAFDNFKVVTEDDDSGDDFD